MSPKTFERLQMLKHARRKSRLETKEEQEKVREVQLQSGGWVVSEEKFEEVLSMEEGAASLETLGELVDIYHEMVMSMELSEADWY
jgi:hypothetical protein